MKKIFLVVRTFSSVSLLHINWLVISLYFVDACFAVVNGIPAHFSLVLSLSIKECKNILRGRSETALLSFAVAKSCMSCCELCVIFVRSVCWHVCCQHLSYFQSISLLRLNCNMDQRETPRTNFRRCRGWCLQIHLPQPHAHSLTHSLSLALWSMHTYRINKAKIKKALLADGQCKKKTMYPKRTLPRIYTQQNKSIDQLWTKHRGFRSGHSLWMKTFIYFFLIRSKKTRSSRDSIVEGRNNRDSRIKKKEPCAHVCVIQRAS